MTVSEKTRAYDLALIIASALNSDVPIKRQGSHNPGYFAYDDEDGAVYVSQERIGDICAAEKADIQAAADYTAVLKLIKDASEAIGKHRDMPETIEYCVFSCLHEFGHAEFFSTESEECIQRSISERNSLIQASHKDAQDFYLLFQDERKAHARRAIAYREIPFERYADSYALNHFPEVIEHLNPQMSVQKPPTLS